MRVLVVLVSLLTIIVAYPVIKTWTLNELSEALPNSKTDSYLYPYQVDALDQIMFAMFSGKNWADIHAVLPSPTGNTTWSTSDLKQATLDPNTSPELLPFFKQAYQQLMYSNSIGQKKDYVEVTIPAMDISTWTENDLLEAISDTKTDPDLLPYLQDAHLNLTESIALGHKVENVSIVTPVGLVSTPLYTKTTPFLISTRKT